jgi:hypothetical protein
MRIEVDVRANAWALTSKDGKRRTRGSLSIPLIDASLIYSPQGRRGGLRGGRQRRSGGFGPHCQFGHPGRDDRRNLHLARNARGHISALIGPELVGILTEPLPPDDAEPLVWELRSVRQRRAALREHSAGLVPSPVA